TSLSIGIFFSLMVAGLATALPLTLAAGLRDQGVPAAVAAHAAQLPPVSTLFASFLGYNPVQNLLGPGVLDKLPAHIVQVLTGNDFCPHLFSGPFHHGLVVVFTAAIAMSVTAAAVSLLRGKQYYYEAPQPVPAAPLAGVAGRGSSGAAGAVF